MRPAAGQKLPSALDLPGSGDLCRRQLTGGHR